MESIGGEMAGAIDPVTIARYPVRRIETQTLEDMSCYFGAFLRRLRAQTVNIPDFWRKPCEGAQLTLYLVRARTFIRWRPTMRRAGIDGLPAPNRQIRAIFNKKAVKKGRPAAWQPGDEYRLLNRLLEYRWVRLFGRSQQEQIGQEAQGIPPRSHPTEGAKGRLLHITSRQHPQRLLESVVTEIPQSREVTSPFDDLVRRAGARRNPQHISKSICCPQEPLTSPTHGHAGGAWFHSVRLSHTGK